MPKVKWISRLPVASLCLLASCNANKFDIAIVQYYRVTPRLPSGADVKAQEKLQRANPEYVAIWGMLGTDNEDNPKLTPTKVNLGGLDYKISNLKTLNKNHEFYYIFEIRDQNPVRGLPVDLMTGNLLATAPEKRQQLPVTIVFNKMEDNTTWIGVGKIEQSTWPTMNAVGAKITAPNKILFIDRSALGHRSAHGLMNGIGMTTSVENGEDQDGIGRRRSRFAMDPAGNVGGAGLKKPY